jgi:hypothetical protein
MLLVTIANQTFMTTIDSPTFSDVSGIKSLLLPQETLFQVCWKKKYTALFQVPSNGLQCTDG